MAHRKEPEKKFTRELRKEMSDRVAPALFIAAILLTIIALAIAGYI